MILLLLRASPAAEWVRVDSWPDHADAPAVDGFAAARQRLRPGQGLRLERGDGTVMERIDQGTA